MTMKLRTVSAAGCEVRMGLAILVSPELCSPIVILCWSCVLMDFPPTLCLIWSVNTKYSALNLYPLNPTSFWGERGGSLLFVFSNLHLVETVGMPWLMAVSLLSVPKRAHNLYSR